MTIIYYTSNREDETFEEKIRGELVKNRSGLPVISVSQKPIDLGENVCVGEHEASTYNTKKQIYEGLKRATTEYVVMAEADFLYPKEYFEFEPKGDKFYCVENVYIAWINRSKFYRKLGSEGAMICHRESLMEIMETYLTEWDMRTKMKSLLFHPESIKVTLETPVVTFKTGNGVSWRCSYIKGSSIKDIPHWGNAGKLRKRFQ